MKFYHGTSLENWEKIQQEGLLWGRRWFAGKELDRCTYLSTCVEEAHFYGDVILRVEYEPSLHSNKNNYVAGCWQLRVYEPINIKDIVRIV